MASVKQMSAGVFLLVLVFSYGIIITEERLLKAKNHTTLYNNSVKEMGTEGGNNLNSYRYLLENEAEYMPVDDFRPTSPGHSPGAGHKNGP